MNKIFEAMGCGAAYVGPKPYGADELHLQDNHNCILVNKDNFVDRIRHYLMYPDELKEIVKNAQEYFIKYHTFDARGKDFIKLLNKFLSLFLLSLIHPFVLWYKSNSFIEFLIVP